MKIKQSPDDFQVDERTDVVPADGPFGLYRLDKCDWTTPDAVDVVRRRWQIRAERLSYGGLKDRHARTTQHLTILDGPRQHLSHHGFTLHYLGQVSEPFGSTAIRANFFRLVVRDLSAAEASAASAALDEVRRDGVANYFDDQRFGSVQEGGDFVARQLVLGHYEAGLKLALTAPYEFDRGPVKQEKSILLNHWGDWTACRSKLARGQARDIVDFLAARPGDYCGAFGRMRADLASLYLGAYQSHLWNRLLAEWLLRRLPEAKRVAVRLKLRDVPMPRGLNSEEQTALAGLSLPLPSARLRYDDAIAGAPPDWPEVLRSVLVEEGLELAQLRLRGLRRPFFSRGERPVLSRPMELAAQADADERHAGRLKLTLSFELPRGSYATLVVKRITGLV